MDAGAGVYSVALGVSWCRGGCACGWICMCGCGCGCGRISVDRCPIGWVACGKTSEKLCPRHLRSAVGLAVGVLRDVPFPAPTNPTNATRHTQEHTDRHCDGNGRPVRAEATPPPIKKEGVAVGVSSLYRNRRVTALRGERKTPSNARWAGRRQAHVAAPSVIRVHPCMI